jgi:hypothetical protein
VWFHSSLKHIAMFPTVGGLVNNGVQGNEGLEAIGLNPSLIRSARPAQRPSCWELPVRIVLRDLGILIACVRRSGKLCRL